MADPKDQTDPYAGIDNRFRPNTGNDQGTDATDPETHSGLADAYRLGWMGQLVDAWKIERHNWQQMPLDFNPLDHIPKGYEGYAEAFAKARNPEMVVEIQRQIDINSEARARRDQRSGWSTFGSDLGAGILDPINLVGGLEVKAVTTLKGLGEGALKIGGLGAATEVVRGSLDPTSTTEETAWGVGGSLVLGGLFGGAIGKVRGGRAAGRLALPIRGQPGITSRFGTRPAPKAGASTFHKGVDLAVPPGTPVYAQREGVVEVARDTGKGGLTVTVNYGEGVRATFMHLSGFGVKEGDRVRPGQVVARSGNTGNSTGPHLHYSLSVNGKAVDPLAYEGGPVAGAEGAAAAPTAEPAGTVNLYEGIAIPETVDFDGRGVKVVIGENPNGAPARYVRETPAETIVQRELERMDAEGRAFDAEPVAASQPDMVTRTVTRYDAKGKAIGSYEIEVPRVVPVRKEAADLGPSTAPTYDPMRVKAAADRLDARADALEAANGPRETVARLRETASEFRDQLTYSDGHFVMGPDGETRFIPPEQLASRDYDPDLAELRAADREKMARDFDSGELADELPFGLSHAGDDVAEDGEHIMIDVPGVLGSFDKKPWTAPRIEGVNPFPANAFETPSDWLNFVVLHEREHSVNPRLEGESLAAYENRINQRAWEELQGGKRPFSPTEGTLEKMAIAPTPMGQMMRAVEDRSADIHQSVQALAGDFGVMLTRNRAGGASIAGGSVFQRAERWIARQAEVRQSIRTAYLDYLGKTSTGSRMQTELSVLAARVPFVGAASRQGALSLNEFRAMVGQAIVSRTAEVPAEARRAAGVFTKLMQDVEGHARELGLFRSTKGYQQRAGRLERRAATIADKAARLPKGDETRLELEKLVERMQQDASDLKVKAEEAVMPTGEQDYFPRYWNASALKAREDDALAMLERGYLREGYGPEAAKSAARGAFQKLVAEPDGDFAVGRPNALNHRSIPVTNEEAWDFVVQDPELVSAVYLRRMGAAIEMTRRFGDPAGLDELDSLRADLIARGVEPAKREKALQLWEDARDRVAGGFHGKDPMSWDNRTVRALKNLANLAVMGKVIYSQVSDVARVIGTSPSGAVRAVYGAMAGDLARLAPGSYAKQAGEALELVMARATAHFIEADDALLVTSDTALERGLAGAQAPFFTANLMMPFTVVMKEWMGLVAAHTLIDDTRAVAAAVQAGKQPSAKMVTRLAMLGIDQNDAQLIALMPFEQGASGLNLPNVMAWEGDKGMRARDLFLAAVNGEIRRSVVTPGPLDRPAIFDGVFHTRKGREEALGEVARLEQEVTDARGLLSQLARRPDDDADKLKAIADLQGKIGEWNRARRLVGRRGRLEAPIASLPFQMHSFAMASGGKVLHGLLSGADRNRTAMIMSLLAGGAIATWLKSSDKQWENMSFPELAGHAFDNSSLGAWFTDIVKSADSATGAYALGSDGLTGAGLTYDDKDRVSDNIGNSVGVGPGLIAGMVEAFVSDDMPWNDRVGAVRRALPFNNLLWWDGTVKTLERSMTQESGATFEPADPELDFGQFASPKRRDAPGMPTVPSDDGVSSVKDLPVLPPVEQLPTPARKQKGRRKRSVAPAIF